MPRNRFVSPQTVRLPLSDGDWIDVKKELNAGEHRRVLTNAVKLMVAGEKTELNPELVGKSKMLEYIVGWSLCDAKDQPVPFSASALDGVDAETFQEIMEAVDAHDEQSEAEREARKNGRAGAMSSAAILPSASS